MYIKGLNFKCTCDACPEQYDVFDNNGNIVGYVRLRWGSLICEYPDISGIDIYYADIGDGFTGSFEDNHQRIKHLNNIADAILKKIDEEKYQSEQEDVLCNVAKYDNSDLSFWIEWYTDCYATGAFSFWYLKDKLEKLKSVRTEWENHRNYKSYYASVEALRIVIDRIDKEEVQECQNT